MLLTCRDLTLSLSLSLPLAWHFWPRHFSHTLVLAVLRRASPATKIRKICQLLIPCFVLHTVPFQPPLATKTKKVLKNLSDILCLSVCLFFCLSVIVCVYCSVCFLSVCLSLCLSNVICLSNVVSGYLSFCQAVCHSICLYVCMSFFSICLLFCLLSTCLSFPLSVYHLFFVHLTVCLCKSLSFYLSVDMPFLSFFFCLSVLCFVYLSACLSVCLLSVFLL